MNINRYPKTRLEHLLNWDGFLCLPPWRNTAEECQYYARFIERRLWRTFDDADWRRLREIIGSVRVPEKLKKATQFLIERHTRNPPTIPLSAARSSGVSPPNTLSSSSVPGVPPDIPSPF